ncbi:type IV pilin protein [Pseudomonas viridiflava]|uniref:type IV pilin protein n=2 Tax=Pseudomonas viridiflava TaxID=33069 RepID=UPI000F011AC6|nr:prepilin-type N-terminal cleavage/methylation domain-containing protein [Pseudomonas viridiflava]
MTFPVRGFTLIELLVTVAIVGILASIAFPAYNSYIDRSEAKGSQMDLLALGLMIDSDYQRNMAYPVQTLTATSQVQAKYPSWSPSQRNFDYALSSTASGYTLTANGKKGGNKNCVATIKENSVRTNTCAGSNGDWQ